MIVSSLAHKHVKSMTVYLCYGVINVKNMDITARTAQKSVHVVFVQESMKHVHVNMNIINNASIALKEMVKKQIMRLTP